MLEVYLDDLRDLLATSKEKLTIMNDKGGDGIIINGLTVKEVKSADEVTRIVLCPIHLRFGLKPPL